MIIDIKTLILVIGISHLMQFLVFYHQYQTNRNLKGIGWWLMWSAAESLGLLLILLRVFPTLLPYIILFQNVIILTGTIFIYFGIMRFFDKKINFKLIVPFFLSYISLHVFFFLVKDDINIRTLLLDIALAFISFLNAKSIYKNRSKSIELTVRFNTIIFIIHGLVFSYRSVMLASGTNVTSVFDLSFFNMIQYLDALIVGLLWTFGFIILLNQKLNSEKEELKTQFEKFFNTSPDAALITRLNEGMFFDCNEGFTRLSGYTRNEMISKSTLELNIWNNPAAREEVVKSLQQNGTCENYETTFQKKNGLVITGLVSAKSLTLNNTTYIYSVTRDISYRKQIENALKESNDKFRELADLLPQIVFETDVQGMLTYTNQQANKILGYPEDFDTRNINTVNLYIPQDQQRAKENIERQFSGKQELGNEYTMIKYDKTLMPVLVYSSPIFKENKPAGLRGIIIDITNLKNSEKIIQQKNEELSKLNALKDKIFSIIGHDLRSPFTTIIGFSELLHHNLRKYSPETIETYVEYIQKSGENTFKLLENLLNWAKTQTGQVPIQLAKTEINKVIQDVINLSIAQTIEKGIDLRFHAAPLPSIITDENLINTILRNLLNNAIKFTNPKGYIQLKAIEKNGFIEIAISDNGIGMSEDIKNHLFTDVIHKTREGTNGEKGTGLGLSICKEFIEKLGGKIRVESEVGIGSTFTFSLPISE